MKSVIIIPTYNEKETIVPLIHRIFEQPVTKREIVVVDDHSPDGTAQAVKTLQTQYSGILHILERPNKLGLGTAYKAGFTWALAHEADLVFEMDADGSHDPADIPRFITAIEQGADVVIGSRKIRGGQTIGWGLHRHIASWGAMTLSRIVLGLKTKDVTSGFRCYHQRVLRHLDFSKITTNGYAFQEEMIWHCEKNDFSIKEIPVMFRDREIGNSKLSYKEIIEFFTTLMRLKLEK